MICLIGTRVKDVMTTAYLRAYLIWAQEIENMESPTEGGPSKGCVVNASYWRKALWESARRCDGFATSNSPLMDMGSAKCSPFVSKWLHAG